MQAPGWHLNSLEQKWVKIDLVCKSKDNKIDLVCKSKDKIDLVCKSRVKIDLVCKSKDNQPDNHQMQMLALELHLDLSKTNHNWQKKQ